MATAENVRSELQNIICEVLCVEPEEVIDTARFFDDLGAESIDLLELSFRCEKRFGIKVEFQKAFPLDRITTDESGHLRPDALGFLRERHPYLDLSRFGEAPHVSQLSSLFTVDVLSRILAERIEAGCTAVSQAAPPASIGSAAK